MVRQKTVLIGLHNEEIMSAASVYFGRAGYSVSTARSLDEMLSKMGIRGRSSDNTELCVNYDWYIMDVNLGHPGNNTCEPSEIIYNHVKEKIINKRAKFISISGSSHTLDKAISKGIPAFSNMDPRFVKLLKNPEGYEI